jgi:ssDNA-binding Zn-finger/Zn-ribbon topoisomerase 1
MRVEARAKQESAPVCPDCGKSMKRRQAKSGKNAGKEFWGCTGLSGVQGSEGDGRIEGNEIIERIE